MTKYSNLMLLAILHVDNKSKCAEIHSGGNLIRIAHKRGIPFFPVIMQDEDEVKSNVSIDSLTLWKIAEVERFNNVILQCIKSAIIVLDDSPETLIENPLKSGYWLSGWELEDLIKAFGIKCLHLLQPMAADKCAETISCSDLGHYGAIVNTEPGYTDGTHWIVVLWETSEIAVVSKGKEDER